MKKYFLRIIVLLLTGCGGGSSTDVLSEENTTGYGLHKNITVTIFWTGEAASSANGDIHNFASGWDIMWMLN
jgi:hypothetical protein